MPIIISEISLVRINVLFYWLVTYLNKEDFMPNINGINNYCFSEQSKKGGKTGQSTEGKKDVPSKESLKSPAVQANELIIKFHLKIKIESKDRFGAQAGVKNLPGSAGVDLSKLIYNGKPITELTQEEAGELISEDGYFGVKNTAQRIFDFAAGSAGDDPERLQVARDAILKGFSEAEQFFGGSLPEISYKTLDKLLGMMDEKIRDLGGTVIDVKA